MRTTLIIDDAVFAASKHKALASGVTLSELTTQALRNDLREMESKPPSTRFEMPVYGGGVRGGTAKLQDSSPARFAELRDDGR